MSYSYSLKAPNKAAATAEAAAQFDKVQEAQPVHAHDRAAALAAAESALGLIAEPGELEEVSLSVSGWLSGQWQKDGTLSVVTGASISVSASITPTKVAAT